MDADLFEYSSCKGVDALLVEPLLVERWSELDAFLQEIWDDRPKPETKFQRELESEEENDEEKVKQRYLKTENRRLKAHRFVGTVCFDDITVNIWPRVFTESFANKTLEKDKAKQRGVMTRNMLHWASRADYFKLSPNHGGSSAPQDISNFFEAYILLFANFTRDLLARQPYWQYQSEIVEGEVLRGRLVMNQYVNDCLARGRWHRLVYEHEPFDFDNLLNRIIKRTCKLAHDFCVSSTVKEKLGEILFELDEVEDVFCTARDCDRVHLNRMHTEYQIVLDNCRMILAQCQADNSGREMKRFCFLLPMDRLFEEYLRVLADDAIQKLPDWKLENKDGLFLAEGYALKTNTDGDELTVKKCFSLIHDLLFTKTDLKASKFIIADAKWKNRGAKVKYGNFGVSQSDMYQMVAYAHGRGSTEVRLLYPAIAEGLPEGGEQASKTKHIATLKTIPREKSRVSPIYVQVHELQIHWGTGESKDTEPDQIEKVEKAVREAFEKMLKHTEWLNAPCAGA